MTTHCRHGHSLQDAYQTRRGVECRSCKREASRKSKAKRQTTPTVKASRQKPKDSTQTRIRTLVATIERTKQARKVDGALLKAYRLGLLSLMREGRTC